MFSHFGWKTLLFALLASLFSSVEAVPEPISLQDYRQRVSQDELLIGYFHGGRNLLLYRAMNAGMFDGQVDVSFWSTKSETDTEFYQVPSSFTDFTDYRKSVADGYMLGRTTGPQLIEGLKSKRLDCAMIGESSFLLMADAGVPAKAIAKLGQDQKDEPGKVVLVRKGLTLDSPQAWQGKSIGSRKGGPYDSIMVREFLEKQGVRQADVTIHDQIPQQELKKQLKERKLDAYFLHLNRAAQASREGEYDLFPNFTFDFANPSLSHALLVCHNDVIKSKRKQLASLLAVYNKRIHYENGLSREQRALYDGQKSLAMDCKVFPGFNLPQYDENPYVSQPLLEEMQQLLKKHGHLQDQVDIAPYIDSSFVPPPVKMAKATVRQPSGAIQRLMKVIDRDGDGLWSDIEVDNASWSRLNFKALDTDSSGKLDAFEVEEMMWKLDPLTKEYRGRQFIKREEAKQESAEQ